MTAAPILSHAQNGEDVVLWRALHHVSEGHYVEVGANSASHDSITKWFYDAGWSGVTIEPAPGYLAEHRQQRPRDSQFEVAITAEATESITLYDIADSGLSTAVADIAAQHEAAGRPVRPIQVPARRLDDVLSEALGDETDIHFMTIDTEGSERTVLESVDLRRWRPWVLVIEATAPNTDAPTHQAWEQLVLDAGYRFCLFDGLSRFYVANEVAAEHAGLAEKLSYPACVLDGYTRAEDPHAPALPEPPEQIGELERELAAVRGELAEAASGVLRWRALAIENATAGARAGGERAPSTSAQRELEALQRTISWRITAPLRQVRPRLNRPVALAARLKNARRFG